jgi:hypothetical protein
MTKRSAQSTAKRLTPFMACALLRPKRKLLVVEQAAQKGLSSLLISPGAVKALLGGAQGLQWHRVVPTMTPLLAWASMMLQRNDRPPLPRLPPPPLPQPLGAGPAIFTFLGCPPHSQPTQFLGWRAGVVTTEQLQPTAARPLRLPAQRQSSL